MTLVSNLHPFLFHIQQYMYSLYWAKDGDVSPTLHPTECEVRQALRIEHFSSIIRKGSLDEQFVDETCRLETTRYTKHTSGAAKRSTIGLSVAHQRLNMTLIALPPLALVSNASTTSFWLNPNRCVIRGFTSMRPLLSKSKHSGYVLRYRNTPRMSTSLSCIHAQEWAD